MNPIELKTFPIHLGLKASAEVQPAFTGMEWYQGYIERHASDGAEGRLISMYLFSAPWDSWEMHPYGHEVVVCTRGSITLLQEKPDGALSRVTLGPGECAINEPGVWHTADVESEAEAIFITAGVGTQHRPR